MITIWADQDGDPVAVDSAKIVGVSVGEVTGPRSEGTTSRVTLIWARGVSQPFMVTAGFDEVIASWDAGRRQDTEELAGWKFQPVVRRSRG